MMDTWHVTPVNDLEEHKESVYCKCNPAVKYEENGRIVIHNAFDGRELYELEESRIN